jgi:hypothetical protein
MIVSKGRYQKIGEPLAVQGLFDKDGKSKIVGPVGIQVRTTILQDFNELG